MFSSIHAGDCSFRFQQQPDTNLNCNPYHNTTLHITCLAKGPLHSALQVVWWLQESSNSQPVRANVESSSHSFIETQNEQWITTTLSLTLNNSSKKQQDRLCVWCQIEVPGRTLAIPSNRLCVKDPNVYSNIQNCSSQQIVNSSFNTVCAENSKLGISLSQNPSQTENTLAVMPTSQLCILSPELLSSFPSTLFSSPTYIPHNTPSAYIGSGVSCMQQPKATRQDLLPSPTKATRDNCSSSMLSNNSLTALCTAVVVCVLLAVVIIVLVAVVLLLCKRRRRQRKTKSLLYSHKHHPNNMPKFFYNRSQLSFSGILQIAVHTQAPSQLSTYKPHPFLHLTGSEALPGDVPFPRLGDTQ